MKLRLLALIALMAAASHAVFAGGLDLRDRYTRVMDEGAEAYAGGQFEDACKDFSDALIAKPGTPEAAFNQGLALARQGKFSDAAAAFGRVLQLVPEDGNLRSRAWYNRGLAQLRAAERLMQPEEAGKQPDQEAVIESALQSLDSFGRAVQADPGFADAAHNRAQVQHFLSELPLQQPPPQQGGGEGEDQQQPQDQGDQQEDQNQSGDQQQDNQQQQQQGGEGEQSRDQQQQGKQEDNKQEQQESQDSGQSEAESESRGDQQEEQQGEGEQQEKESEQDEKEQKEGAGGEQKEEPQQAAEQMSEQEARNLLNLLGNRPTLIMRQGNHRPDPKRKDW
ncbi:tetratricopeptide repeat protein [Candidatus Poribacteria bacterium]|nr:tetratricopeptide repeat protein [Candidatus Poribacteria bacterium]